MNYLCVKRVLPHHSWIGSCSQGCVVTKAMSSLAGGFILVTEEDTQLGLALISCGFFSAALIESLLIVRVAVFTHTLNTTT